MRRSFVAVARARREHIKTLGKLLPDKLETILEYQLGVLIHLQVTCEQLRVLPEADDARRVLCSMIDSERELIQAFLYSPQDYEQHTLDSLESSQIWLISWERLCMLAGFPDDPVDS
jgi:hypothetical protein